MSLRVVTFITVEDSQACNHTKGVGLCCERYATPPVRVERPGSLTVWNKPKNVALVTIAGILVHLFLRYLLPSPRIAWQAPLLVILIVGGVPLLIPLTQK